MVFDFSSLKKLSVLIAPRWRRVAKDLGMDDYHIKIIENSNPISTASQYAHQMLMLWWRTHLQPVRQRCFHHTSTEIFNSQDEDDTTTMKLHTTQSARNFFIVLQNHKLSAAKGNQSFKDSLMLRSVSRSVILAAKKFTQLKGRRILSSPSFVISTSVYDLRIFAQ